MKIRSFTLIVFGIVGLSFSTTVYSASHEATTETNVCFFQGLE